MRILPEIHGITRKLIIVMEHSEDPVQEESLESTIAMLYEIAESLQTIRIDEESITSDALMAVRQLSALVDAVGVEGDGGRVAAVALEAILAAASQTQKEVTAFIHGSGKGEGAIRT